MLGIEIEIIITTEGLVVEVIKNQFWQWERRGCLGAFLHTGCREDWRPVVNEEEETTAVATMMNSTNILDRLRLMYMIPDA